MPKWGLTAEQRDAEAAADRPWGLAAELLEPAKTITDPVHGDVYVNRLEALLIDSPCMQRLRRVRQLGTAHLVYPSATHSRFSHALGTMRAAQDLLDAVVDNRNGPRPDARDLFAEWPQQDRGRRVAEATVLARVGALLHDLCHVPLGHTVEDDLGLLTPHDANVDRFERLWRQVPDHPRVQVEEAAGGELFAELRGLILSKEGAYDPCECCGTVGAHRVKRKSRYPFVADIVGNTICADLIDYLQRDHYATGLPLELGHRFINDFYVMNAQHVRAAERMVVRVTRDGQRRADVLSELVKYLRYRYELSERVLNHHSKIAADAMVGKLLEMWTDDLWVQCAQQLYGDEIVPDTRKADVADVRAALAQARPEATTPGTPDAVRNVDARVREHLEHAFTSRSDDGLLEMLARPSEQAEPSARRQGVAALATSVLDRALFKSLAVAAGDGDRALAKQIHKDFGGAAARRKLERDAAAYAGIKPGWQLVLWIPEPRMRMKVAQVLTDDNGNVVPLSELHDTDSSSVLDQHRRLWSVAVYGHSRLRSPGDTRAVDAALAYLRDKMDVQMSRWDGSAVLSRQRLAAERIGDHQDVRLSREGRDRLAGLALAALGDTNTFDGLLDQVWQSGITEGLIKVGLDRPREV